MVECSIVIVVGMTVKNMIPLEVPLEVDNTDSRAFEWLSSF